MKVDIQCVQPEVEAFPQFAPLSTSFVKFLLERQEMLQGGRRPFATTVEEQVRHVVHQFQTNWTLFEQRVNEKRQSTYELMNPIVQRDISSGDQYVSPSWLRETLSDLMPMSRRERVKKDLFTAQTLSLWSERNVLRHRGWGQIEAHSVATILMARQFDEFRERSWLPSCISPEEPTWWCYSQTFPVNGKPSPIVPCPIPLPKELPASTLLWTPWIGASWDPLWLRVGSLGAIRWAGAGLDARGQRKWQIDAADLRLWNTEISSFDMGFLSETPEILHTMAELTLLQLALTRLKGNE